MVDLADNASHACTFNRRSVGVEMGGFASRGFDAPLVAATARVFAYLCHYLQIPVRHARAGVAPGIASHRDLGAPGGGHHDPSDDPNSMEKFDGMFDDEYRNGDFTDVWDQCKPQRPCLLSPDSKSSSTCGSRYRHSHRTFIRSAVFNRRSRCSGIALPSTAITVPKCAIRS